jgi:hypothetical protein
MLVHVNVYIMEVKYVTYIWTLCNEIGSFVFKRGTFFIKRENIWRNAKDLSIQLHTTPVIANWCTPLMALAPAPRALPSTLVDVEEGVGDRAFAW